MKSINVKKIAAVAAGAALIGTAFAGAATTVDEGLGNYVPTLFSNGEPNVQVVVGSYSLPSDGVAAANIAAALGNKAYTTTTVEAAAPAAGAATTVATVVLNVTRPATAVAANEYLCTTGLSDNLDNNGCGVGSTALNKSTTKASRVLNLPNTWKELSDSDWSALAPSRTITVSGSTSTTSTERQFLECYAQTGYNDQYDAYVSDQMECLWRATFSSPLPMCADTNTAYSACDSSSKIDTTSTPSTIYFLGDPWVITGATMTGAAGAVNTLSVGKSYTVKVTAIEGQTIDAGTTGFKLKLNSVGAPSGTGSLSDASIVVTAPDGRNVTKVRQENSASIKISELGNFYIKVGDCAYSAAAGASNTCELSAFSDSITLQNGTIDQSLYPNWRAMIDANNRSSTQGISDLRVYNDNFQFSSTSSTRAKPGDVFTLINGLTANSGYQIEFKGSDLGATDRDNLQVGEIDLSANLPNSGSPGQSVSYGAISFCSGRADAFRLGSDNVACIYFLAKNKTSSSPVNYTGYAVYQNSTGQWNNVSSGSAGVEWTVAGLGTPGAATALFVSLPPYYYASGGGSDTSVRFNVSYNGLSLANHTALSAALLSGNASNTNNATSLNITIGEVTNDSVSTVGGAWHLYYDYGASGQATTDGNFRSAIGGTTNDNVNYTSSAFAVAFNGNMPYCSVRGSCVESFSSSGATVKYATRLGKAVYVLRKLEGAVSAAGPTVTCTTYPCDLGGGTILQQSPSGVAATVAAGTTQVQVVSINTGVRPLVVLDAEASSTQPLIVVGGPFVNSIAASMEAASLFDECNPAVGGDGVVQIEGNKVLVAGCSADDTQMAAKELISFLASWDPTATAATTE